MIFLIMIGATLFNSFIEATALPQTLVGHLNSLALPPLGVMLMLLVFYFILGCFMDSLSMVLLTVPVVVPIILAQGYDPVWFGIVLVTVVEVGLITPPIGMNLFVIQGTTPGLALSTVARGILPFVVADAVRIAFLLAFPALCLWLPKALGF